MVQYSSLGPYRQIVPIDQIQKYSLRSVANAFGYDKRAERRAPVLPLASSIRFNAGAAKIDVEDDAMDLGSSRH